MHFVVNFKFLNLINAQKMEHIKIIYLSHLPFHISMEGLLFLKMTFTGYAVTYAVTHTALNVKGFCQLRLHTQP